MLELTLAQRLQNYAETNNILPTGHYGGRAQRSTTDALLNLTVWVKNQWARGKTVGALFVDIKAAFPTVNPRRLNDTLHQMGFCQSLIRLVDNFLSGRSKTFQLGDYQSSPKDLTIGLPQGSPLSVILSILYNTPLLRIADGLQDTIALGFIDDVAFVTAGLSTEDVTQSLQSLADQELAWGSKYGAAFDRAKSQCMLFSHKTTTQQPIIKLGDVTLEPQPTTKWLGVLIDSKLRFTGHVQAQVANGSKVVNRLASLARTGWGIPLRQCKQLIAALVHSRMDYTCVVWHRYGITTGVSSKIQRVNNTALCFAFGVFRTHPTPCLQHDSCSAPAHASLDAKSDAAILGLLTLPESNPAAVLIRTVALRNRKNPKSLIHHTLRHGKSLCGALKTLPEVIDSSTAHPPALSSIRGVILPERGAALSLINANLTEPPTNCLISFSDGSHNPDKGAGAAAVEFDTADQTSYCTLSVRVGDTEDTFSYQAELTSLELAVANAGAQAPRTTLFFWVFTDNQKVIPDITGQLQAKAGLTTCIRIRKALNKSLLKHPQATIALIWCPSKC